MTEPVTPPAQHDDLLLELGYLTEQVLALKAELHYTDLARLEAENALALAPARTGSDATE